MTMEIIPGPNLTVTTAPAGDSSNKPASTQFVTQAIASAISTAVATVASFSVNKGAVNQTSVPSGTSTQVTWPNEVYDIGGFFASNVWTPPAGKISLTFGFIADGTIAAGSLSNTLISKNGATTTFKVTLVSNLTNVGYGLITAEDVANGTDTYGTFVSLTLSSGSASIRGDITNTFFMGHWFSA